MSKMTCPTCGHLVRVVSSSYIEGTVAESTMHYEPMSDLTELEKAVVEADLAEDLAQYEMLNTYDSEDRLKVYRQKYEAARSAHVTARTKLIAARAAQGRTE